MSVNEITAVIPVRAGSTRVKNKNIKSFAGSSLLEIKIEQLKRNKEISEILVSSDSFEMLETARRHGVKAVRRPDEYCDEKTRTFNEVVTYVAKNEVETESMMWVPCVCPCVRDETIYRGIHAYKSIKLGEDTTHDSIATSVLIKEYIFDESKPVNFSIEHHVKSQYLPNWHYIVNGFFIANTADMANWGFVYGRKPYLIELSKEEAVDIDDEFDFEIAEYLFKTRIMGVKQ